MATITSTGTEHLNGQQFGANLAAYRKNINQAGYGITPKQAKSGNTAAKMKSATTQDLLRNTMRAGVRQAGYNQKSNAMNSSLAQTGGSMYAPAKSAPVAKVSKMAVVKSALQFGKRSGAVVSSGQKTNSAKAAKRAKLGPSRYAGKLSAHLRGATGAS